MAEEGDRIRSLVPKELNDIERGVIEGCKLDYEQLLSLPDGGPVSARRFGFVVRAIISQLGEKPRYRSRMREWAGAGYRIYSLLATVSEGHGDLTSASQDNEYTGDMVRILGRTEDALRHYEKALTQVGSAQERRFESRLHGRAGDMARDLKRFDVAYPHYVTAANLSEETGDNRGAAYQHGFAADMAKELGEKGEACRHYVRSAELAEEAGDLNHAGFQYSFLSRVTEDLGDVRGAYDHCLKSVELAHRRGDFIHECEQLGHAGRLANRLKLFGEAYEHYNASAGLAERNGNFRVSSVQHSRAAQIAERLGRGDRVIMHRRTSAAQSERFDPAYAADQRERMQRFAVNAVRDSYHQLSREAEEAKRQGRVDDALRFYDSSAKKAESEGDIKHAFFQRSYAGDMAARLNRPADAYQHNERAATLGERLVEGLTDRGEVNNTRVNIAYCWVFAGKNAMRMATRRRESFDETWRARAVEALARAREQIRTLVASDVPLDKLRRLFTDTAERTGEAERIIDPELAGKLGYTPPQQSHRTRNRP